MRTETKEEQLATLIRKVVKLWDTEYSKKLCMRPTVPRANAIDKEMKIMHKNKSEQFFAKIELSKEIDPFYLYYHFDLNEKKPSFYIRLKYRYDVPFNVDEFSEFLSNKYKSKKINDIPLKAEWSNRKGRKIMRGLKLDKNLIEETHNDICDYMEKLIRLTQKSVCEYLNIKEAN